jgi:Tol biopolymer transport system component
MAIGSGRRRSLVVALAGAVVALLSVATVWAAPTTRLVSVSSSEAHGDGTSGGYWGGSISANGRFVVFESTATNLVPNDTNGVTDVFLRDRSKGTTRRISVSSAGAQTDGYSQRAVISPDGRFVLFSSIASNLIGNDSNAAEDIFIRDRAKGTTRRVSIGNGEQEGNGSSYGHSMSPDGRFIVFGSSANNLVGADTNAASDIFVRDRRAGTTSRVSLNSNGIEGNGPSDSPWISADGRLVSFSSNASNLVAGDTNGVADVFVRNRETGQTRRVSISTQGGQADGASDDSMISADGRVIVFYSSATNLVPNDDNADEDVFVRLLATGKTRIVSVSSAEVIGDAESRDPAISANGRYVTFGSLASNLVGTDTNAEHDVFVRDRKQGTTTIISRTAGGSESNGLSFSATISDDGRFVVFSSDATNLIADDTNGVSDVFVRGPLG